MEPVHGTFDPATFAAELAAPSSHVGTRLLLENEGVRVWEIRLAPGERAPFHRHERPYLWVCVDGGRARSRFPNGHLIEFDYETGGTAFTTPSASEPEIHDLENTGSTVLRFTTVELLR